MDWIYVESFWFFCPGFGDEFIGCETFECLEPSAEIIGIDEVCEMTFELLMTIVVVSLNGGLLDRSVHSLDLSVGPWMSDFG